VLGGDEKGGKAKVQAMNLQVVTLLHATTQQQADKAVASLQKVTHAGKFNFLPGATGVFDPASVATPPPLAPIRVPKPAPASYPLTPNAYFVTTPADKSDDNNGWKIGVGVGVGVGGCLLLLIIIVVVICCLRHRANHEETEVDFQQAKVVEMQPHPVQAYPYPHGMANPYPYTVPPPSPHPPVYVE
jgi:hypothetical protein